MCRLIVARPLHSLLIGSRLAYFDYKWSINASGNTIKDHMGNLQEESSLMCQDLQKNYERNTAVESRISAFKQKLPTALGEIKSITQLVNFDNL